MNLTISVATSCKSLYWKKQTIAWDKLIERLQSFTRTPETFAEYTNMTKTQQSKAKDTGGFVGGGLKGGRRKAQNVLSRSLIALDADFADVEFADRVRALGYEAVIYSTHSHTPEKPRLRVIFPLSVEIAPDKYPAVARKLAAMIDINQFDDTTYQAHRLMYWPSASQDAEAMFEHIEGAVLDAEDILLTYADWKDSAQWPVSDRVNKVHQSAMKKAGDPESKGGLVGAFCRTYDIPMAIESYLADAYEPCAMQDRYTYKKGSTAAGLVVYDGVFAYSNHGTDPASGRLCNAFDLVRLHKFSELDDDAGEDTPINKMPSYKAMQEFASKDGGVRRTLLQERCQSANNDFSGCEFDEQPQWEDILEYDTKGRIISSIRNVSLILSLDPKLKNIAYNELCGQDVLIGEVPWRSPCDWQGHWWSDADDACLRAYLESFGIKGSFVIRDAFSAVTRKRAFHPIRDYLNGLPAWDGVERVERLLIDYMGSDDNAYTRGVTKAVLVAAVARVFVPGIKFDNVLVLNGEQGIGKSTLFSALGGEWFSDSLSLADTTSKTGPEKLHGYWIIEVSEMAGMKRADVETVKSFITRTRDIFRPSYGRYVVEFKRQCIVVASTNAETGFLRDITGNRRFWPVKARPSDKKAWELTKVDIAQIWAEALHLWRNGAKLVLPRDIEEMAIQEQTDAIEQDDRQGLVEDYLNRLLPENWDDMDLSERRMFLASKEQGAVHRTTASTIEILCELFGREPGKVDRREAHTIAGILKRIGGWKREDLQHTRIYGPQRPFRRNKKVDTLLLPKVVTP
jgi:putative DNA primase/helicase